MEIWSETKDSRLAIEPQETEINYPSFNFAISILEKGFCEAYTSAWVTGECFASFVTQLRRCEKSLQGRARLDGMSPDELMLLFESVDTSGHFRLVYCITADVSGPRSWHERTVSGSFDLDSGLFANIAAEFAQMLEANPV